MYYFLLYVILLFMYIYISYFRFIYIYILFFSVYYSILYIFKLLPVSIYIFLLFKRSHKTALIFPQMLKVRRKVHLIFLFTFLNFFNAPTRKCAATLPPVAALGNRSCIAAAAVIARYLVPLFTPNNRQCLEN